MQMFRKMIAGMLLTACVTAQAQTATNPSSVKPARAKSAKQQTQEQVLLDQLNGDFRKLGRDHAAIRSARLSEPNRGLRDT